MCERGSLRQNVSAPILVAARSFPPSVEAGGSTVAYNLFRRIAPLDYAVIRGDLFPQDQELSLPATTWVWDIWPRRYQYTRFSIILVPLLVAKILGVCHKLKPRHLLLFYPFDFYAIAGWIASHLLHLPYSVYYYDTWEESQINLLQKLAAHFFEPLLTLKALNVFVISPALEKHFQKKYNIKPVPILHPLSFERFTPLVRYQFGNKDIYRIVHTGNVSKLNLDSVEDLIQAVRMVNSPRIEIDFYTGQSPDVLKRMLGIRSSDAIRIRFIPTAEIASVQQNADFLFVGLAFSGLDEFTLATTFPTKFVEYLTAGQPILVHAPAQSYLAEFVQKHQCAELIDQPGIKPLQTALLNLIANPERALSLSQKAVQVASLFEDHKQVGLFAQKLGMTMREVN